jgi:predicted small lipoprotein YifL
MVASWMALATLATLFACGNNGAPPYAPESSPAVPTGPTRSPTQGLAAVPPTDPHVVYDLREKCAQDAQQWYRHFFEDSGMYPSQSTTSHGFTSHYNSKVNECFAVTSAISSIKDSPSRNGRLVEAHTLADVLENRTIGTFTAPAVSARATTSTTSAGPTECRVAEKTCTSKQDWDALTAPYMSD